MAAAATAGEQAFAQSPVINHGIAGDWDADSDCVAVTDLMASKGVKTVIGQGDYGYDFSPSEFWNKCFFDNGIPRLGTGFSMWGAIGNHDPKDEYVKLFGMDSAVTKRIVDRHYQIFMNTEEDFGVGSSQYDKVVDILKDAKQQKAAGKVDWISVSIHQPAYSSSSGHPPVTELRTTYQELWEQGNVDFVFQGHNHNYERTYPLTWLGSKYQRCSSETTNYVDLDDKDCIIFFTVGTGGRTSYSLSSTIPNYIVTSERTKSYGYLNMGIDNASGLVRFQMFNTDGETISDFTVKRTINATATPSTANATATPSTANATATPSTANATATPSTANISLQEIPQLLQQIQQLLTHYYNSTTTSPTATPSTANATATPSTANHAHRQLPNITSRDPTTTPTDPTTFNPLLQLDYNFSNSHTVNCQRNSHTVNCQRNSHTVNCQRNSHTVNCQRNSHTVNCQRNSHTVNCQRNSHTVNCQRNSHTVNCQRNSHTVNCQRNSHTVNCQRNSHTVNNTYPTVINI